MFFSLTLWSIFIAVFGAMVGSFLNVLIYRLPREALSVSKPKRSFCTSCGTSIPWYDNIPIFSYLLLCGRCRYCGFGFSLRYAFVEALTALLFVLLTLHEGPAILERGPDWPHLLGVFVVHMAIIALVVVVAFIDLDFKIIPDEITCTGAVLAPLVCLLLPGLQEDSRLFVFIHDLVNARWAAGLLASLGGAAAGGGVLLGVGALGKVLLKREALGMGDVKFMFFMGGIFGFEGVLLIFFVGCFVGSLVGVPFRIFTGKHEIPFGPFLSVGVVLTVFFKAEMLKLLLLDLPELIRSAF